MRRSMVTVCLFASLVFPASGGAARGGAAELQTLASALANELADSQIDGATQDEVREHLERSLALVRGAKGRAGGDACVDFAVPIYGKHYEKTSALEKSMALCSRRTDTALLRVAYPVFSKVLQPAAALEEAAEIAQRKDLWGKAELVELAKGHLSRIYQETDALKKAADLAAPVARDGAPCVQRSFETYVKVLDLQAALTKSFAMCAGER
jgi:hypothetical protein